MAQYITVRDLTKHHGTLMYSGKHAPNSSGHLQDPSISYLQIGTLRSGTRLRSRPGSYQQNPLRASQMDIPILIGLGQKTSSIGERS